MSKIKRKTGSDFGSEGLGREETKGQNRGARSRYAEEMPERARRWISPMGMPAIDVRELSDEMLIFMLQLMAPEKYGSPDPQGGDAESHRSSVSSDQSLAGKKAGGGRSEMPGEAPARGKTEYGMRKTGGNDQSSVISDRAAAGESMALATDAGSAGVRSELPGSSEMPDSRRGFILYDADGEWLMRQKCPEIGGGRWWSRDRGQSGRGLPQSKPWRNYGAPWKRRAFSGIARGIARGRR